MSNLRIVVVGLLSLTWLALSPSAIIAQANVDEAVVAQPAALPDAADASVSPDDLQLLILPLTHLELAELAGRWQQNAKNHLTKISHLNLALRDATDDEAQQIRDQLLNLTDAQSDMLGNYVTVLDEWELKGGSEEEITSHRTYISALRIQSLRTVDIKTIFEHGVGWLLSVDGGLFALTKIVTIMVAVLALLFTARFTRKLLSRTLARVSNISTLLSNFLLGVVYWMTLVVGLMIVLALIGINVTPIFAVVGGLSFILGFALQETLGNLASGLLIMVLKPFDAGDFVETAGVAGIIDDMTIVSTTIRTFDNRIIVIPNSKIWGDVITNVSAADTRRVDLVFGIGYSDSAEEAKKVLAIAVSEHPLCLKEPAPEIFVGELGDSSVNLFCRPWVKTPDYWTVYWDLTGGVKERFDAAGITIPFPQRDIHLFPSDKEATST
jgi:small conductance mechanosensitive channel